MTKFTYEEGKCRICLEDEGDVRWTAALYSYSSLTYKDCFYKYTLLKCFDENDFSTMLCRNCANGLEYVDAFISKATETHAMLLEKFSTNIVEDDNIKPEPINGETLEFEINPEIQISRYEDANMEIFITPDSPSSRSVSPIVQTRQKRRFKSRQNEKNACINSVNEMIEYDSHVETTMEENDTNLDIESSAFEDDNTEVVLITPHSPSSRSVTPIVVTKEQRIPYSIRRSKKRTCKNSTDEAIENDSHLDKKKLSKGVAQPMCCTICSKVLSSKYKVKKHEETHKNRERNETCPECGLKFFSKVILKTHMLTHGGEREKNFKCEFCDKAFYSGGGLSIHRRIHLGKELSCRICAKQYFRQFDLDKHLASHSAVRINSKSNGGKKKCFIRCKECGKEILTTGFRSHNAIHTNEPLYKCSICNKEFFHRTSCVKHLRTTHKKVTGETKQFVVPYKKNRVTRLYLEQNTDIQICKK